MAEADEDGLSVVEGELLVVDAGTDGTRELGGATDDDEMVELLGEGLGLAVDMAELTSAEFEGATLELAPTEAELEPADDDCPVEVLGDDDDCPPAEESLKRSRRLVPPQYSDYSPLEKILRWGKVD